MSYDKLKPLEGVSGYEPTAFTKKTIKELIEEEQRAMAMAEADTSAAEPAEPTPAPAPKPARPLSASLEKTQPPTALSGTYLRQPPQMRGAMPPRADYVDAVHESAAAQPQKRGFFARLLRG